MGERKAKLLKNMALKEGARLPHFVKRQQMLQGEIDQISALLERMKTLREYARDQTVQQAHKLHTNRYYELRLIEESETLVNKLEFLMAEMTNVTEAIARMSHKKQLVSDKARQVLKEAQLKRETMLEASQTAYRIVKS
ncbi:MAG: hypothetical protein JJ868_12030 [Shimia sp.]|uniref:hypothetical protein n=1 Tax=Shimia sp. TaxID=1954381 RepID=UPI001B2D6339|nr:hypothetical protein [Shimia sp.]MBO6898092.1 hypothetical protein [Shimia sp.]